MHPSPLNKIPKLQHDIMRFQLLQTLLILTNMEALVLLSMPAAFATPQKYPPIAKPGCDDACGDISIPYPFGTTENCYSTRSFWVTCKHTLDNPPKLFLQDTKIEIKNISLDGQATVMQFVGQSCYYPDTDEVKKNEPTIWFPKFITVNNTANTFTIVGCDAYGFIYGKKNKRNFSTGCTATCRSLSDVEDGYCTGSGCCQTSIPKNVWKVNIDVRSYNNYSNVRDITTCTYGFLIDKSAFNFSRQNLTNLKNVEELPMVVDWAIGMVTSCSEAQKVPSNYACKSANSTCYKPENGYGYRCQCEKGYYGNPYISDGCQDINECSNPDQIKICEHGCVNTPGSFYCICPKGYYRINETSCILKSDESLTVKLAAGIPSGIILLLAIAWLTYMEYNRRHLKRMKQKWSSQNGKESVQRELQKIEPLGEKFKIFSSSELSKATNNFKESNIVDKGGFDIVYKGVLPNKTTVAITKSKIVQPNQNPKQVEQFVKEVIVFFQIDHENIVKLLGCCFETEIPHLVYEFISSDTLSACLHDAKRAHMLTWEKRLKIAVKTADVLLCLHSTDPSPIIHGDVKSDNILLMDNYTVKVVNFGASRLISLDETQIFTDVQGTKGYLDPEYFITEQLTTKSDVYSFGVVLLELVTGRKAFRKDAPLEERSLVAFSQRMMKQNSFVQFIDGNIASHIHTEQVMEVAELAESCIKMNGDERPCMKMVAEKLKRLMLRKSQSSTEQNTPEGFYGITTFVSGGSTGAGSGSFVDQTISPMSGGR